MRSLDAQTYSAIKAAFRRLVKSCGGLEAAATLTRVGKSQLHEYGSLQHEVSFPPADVIADLERDAGDAIVSALLADLVEPRPHVPGDPADRCMTATAKVGAVCGEVRAARDVHGDGGADITPNEATAIIGAAEDGLAELEALIRDMRVIQAAGTPLAGRRA